MRSEQIKACLRALPEVADWPDLLALVERVTDSGSIAAWEYPLLACRAVGGTPEAAIPAAAAIFCSLGSIHLVDDMLDEDPRGDYHRLGVGPTANLALALQGAAHRLLGDAACEPALHGALQANLAKMAMATAYGQHLDLATVTDEEGYWRVVAAKTPPLFGSAFFLGALLGGASLATARTLEDWGGLLGKLIQVSDDLGDAMRTPLGADWKRPGNNLAILYALSTDHHEREAFAAHLATIDDPASLVEAQRILLQSGAVSYCSYRLLQFAEEGRALLAEMSLPDAAPLDELLDSYLRPLHRLFRVAGAEWLDDLPSPGDLLSRVSP